MQAEFSTAARAARGPIDERVVVTGTDEPAAVPVSPDDLAALEETLEILSDPAAMADLRAAHAEIESGTTVELTELHRR